MSGISMLLWVALVVGLLWMGRAGFRAYYIAAQPDQWLLRLRDGRMVDAGVGIARWRRPGDMVVRFTSTMQRVSFTVDALSLDRQPVVLDGFLLWSIDERGEAPFRAYRKMGLVGIEGQDRTMQSRKHLLTTPQHRAFRKLMSAEVQRHASTLTLDDLLLRQDRLIEGIEARMVALAEGLGMRVDQVEIVQTRAQDDAVMKDLGSAQLELIREEAARVRLEAAERVSQRELESRTRLALEDATARRDREAAEATATLELEQRRAELLTLRHEIERQRLEHERNQRLMALEADREVNLRAQAIEGERALAREAGEAALQAARRLREAVVLAERLGDSRAEAEARRDVALLLAAAEEAKSDAVRQHEIQRLVIEKMSGAISAMPIKDARWISIGADSPMGSLAGLVTGLHSLIQPDALTLPRG